MSFRQNKRWRALWRAPLRRLREAERTVQLFPRPTTVVIAILALFFAMAPWHGGGQVGATTLVPDAPGQTDVPDPTSEPTEPIDTPITVDPDAPAVLPPLPVDTPLQSGLTPEGVAAAVVPGVRPESPSVSATGAVLFDPADGVILAGVDPQVGRPMASTTKIMTVLVGLEALQAGIVDADVTVSDIAAATGQQPGVATLGLTAGQVVPLADLLAADMLRSGNDGAVAIAEHVAGNETAFVAQMNRRAETLGLADTQFVDSSGLSNDPAHHATPLDLALLGQEAMGHPDFAAWAGAPSLDISPFGILDNRNEMLTAYPGTTGIKTGFTNLAGLTLVASAERDGRTLYAVVLGSEDRVADTTALFDHGFEDYMRPMPFARTRPAGEYRTSAGPVTMAVAEDLARTVGVESTVETVVRLAPDVGLPIQVGTPLGEAVLVVDGHEVEATPLLADTAPAVQTDTAGAAVADTLRAFARLAERRATVAG